MDADVMKLCLQLGGVLDQQMKSLLIVAINHCLVSHVEGNCLEELYPIVQLFCSICQGQELVRAQGARGQNSDSVVDSRLPRCTVTYRSDPGRGAISIRRRSM